MNALDARIRSKRSAPAPSWLTGSFQARFSSGVTADEGRLLDQSFSAMLELQTGGPLDHFSVDPRPRSSRKITRQRDQEIGVRSQTVRSIAKHPSSPYLESVWSIVSSRTCTIANQRPLTGIVRIEHLVVSVFRYFCYIKSKTSVRVRETRPAWRKIVARTSNAFARVARIEQPRCELCYYQARTVPRLPAVAPAQWRFTLLVPTRIAVRVENRTSRSTEKEKSVTN